MIYLDNNATTRPAREALTAMRPYCDDMFHNPGSVSGFAVGLRDIVGRARRMLADLLHTLDASSLVFTSGATESNNWVVSAVADGNQVGHLITSAIEHLSVLEPMRRLESRGWTLTVLPVAKSGLVSPDDFASALREDTQLVSIMAANNETGVIEPISELAAILKERVPTALFHTDATQAVGKMRVSLTEEFENVDLLSLSAHKLHGPKGCGALFIREDVTLPPMILGGGQEDGRRSGTTNVAGVVGLGAAAALVHDNMDALVRMRDLRDGFERRLKASFPDVVVHGTAVLRLPNTSCFSLPGCNANSLADLLAQQEIYVGTGSACSSGSLHPPRTLLEMGVEYEIAAAALRVSLSRYTEQQELDRLMEALKGARGSACVQG